MKATSIWPRVPTKSKAGGIMKLLAVCLWVWLRTFSKTCCALDYALDNDLDNAPDNDPENDLDSDLNDVLDSVPK